MELTSLDGPPSPWTAQQRRTLTLTSVAAVLLLSNVTNVLVALPALSGDLGLTPADQQWAVSAYALVLAALLLAAGALADDHGRRRMLLGGFALFAVTSLASGLAPSALVFILVRGVQGAAGAALLSTAMALIAHEFQGAARRTALGVFGAMLGLGLALGPLLGGALTQWLSWRWVFLVNVPFATAAVASGLRTLPESRPALREWPDWAGVATLLPALFLLMLALIEGNDQGWASPATAAEFGAAAVALTLFVLVERRGARPMVDLGLFRLRTFTAAAVAVFAFSAAVPALLVYLVLYLEGVLHQGPLAVGAELLPFAAVSFVAAPVSGALIARLGDRTLITSGLLVAAAGTYALRRSGADGSWTALLPGLVLCGAAQGMLNPPITNAAVGAVPPERSGMASGVNNTARQLGVATGIAALGAIFHAKLGHPAPGPGAAAASVAALHLVLLVASAVAAAGALAAFVLLRNLDDRPPVLVTPSVKGSPA
ncbi:MFS transporter [Paraconexibacter antarcticus]|uniref:MFS transporter n=1 Tax=Paraconexibacter antarcticus TaxID=2949664 RepID=A0ABY5DXK8_9ACTN|nr:MFS transporter [Paraconexibacter antarcticus]UTI66289.1 MFS transporter [Paraconexibacter antarcticus]